LTELNELDNDLREQANLLADKNAKLAQAIKEKNDLQTQLTNEKNLNQTLQAQINNHTCPALAPHVFPPVNEANCSHADYAEIKEQRDNYQPQYQLICQEKEQQITHQINQSLNLGLKEPSLEQVIERIQELINKPPLTFYQEFSDSELEEQLKSSQQTISKLEKELKEQAPFGEDLNAIKELELQSLEELFGKRNNL